MLFRVGAAEIGGLIEVVEWDEPRELAWTSVLGIDQRGRWRLRELPGGRTRVELRMAYGVAGSGLSGWIAERDRRPDGHRAPAPQPAASSSAWSSTSSCASGPPQGARSGTRRTDALTFSCVLQDLLQARVLVLAGVSESC